MKSLYLFAVNLTKLMCTFVDRKDVDGCSMDIMIISTLTGLDSPQRRQKVRRISNRPVQSVQRPVMPGRSGTSHDWFPGAWNPRPASHPYQVANLDGPSSNHSKHGSSCRDRRKEEIRDTERETYIGRAITTIDIKGYMSPLLIRPCIQVSIK